MSDRASRLLKYLHARVELSHFVSQPILTESDEQVGTHVHAILKSGEVLASGTHSDPSIAQQIAISEILERVTVEEIGSRMDEQALRYGMDKVPSTSGFAVGFDDRSTKMRSICEGLERWLWSQWIDRKYEIEHVELVARDLTPLAQALAGHFDSFRSFKKTILIPQFNVMFDAGVVIGIKGKGVFAGSRVTPSGNELWTHGFVEAHRNFVNYSLNAKADSKADAWYFERVKHFAENGHLAFESIANAKNKNWPIPKVHLLESRRFEDNLFYLWRCLFEDFIPWHEGTVERFVY